MFKEDTLLNVIIPVYNRAGMIEKTLDSIYNSQLKNIRVICVDDGSRDNSVEVIRNYQKDKSNLILLESNHGGVSSARNKGIELCNSGYITFLDSDDYLGNNISDIDLEQAVLRGADVISFDFCVNNEIKSTFEIRSRECRTIRGGVENIRYGEKHFSSFLFKYSLLKDYNIRFYEGIQYNEDEVFRTYALYHSKKTEYINKIWFTYNKHSDSLSHSSEKMKGTNHVLKIWNYAKEYFNARYPQDASVIEYCDEKINWVKNKIANEGGDD